ncbi:MAG: TasA family protein [Bacilli bacterium]|nr:TasA family protein [Bacilli bacterium]
MKGKILIIIGISMTLLFTVGITYSYFQSNTGMFANENIAKFIFNADSLDELCIDLSDLKPGDTKSYDFSITNSMDTKVSDVNVQYQLIIKTYHLMPITIKLYSVVTEEETLIMNCDETYSRNENNELLCSTDNFDLTYNNSALNDYRLVIEFPSTYDDPVYANLTDFIDIEANSWQKIE